MPSELLSPDAMTQESPLAAFFEAKETARLREKDRLIEQAWLSGFASGCYWTVIAIVVWIAIVACLDAGYWAAG